MKASHNLAKITTTFDADNLVPNAGLVAPALPAHRLGVADLVDRHVRVGGDAAANAGAKALTLVGAALAGGDPIEDCDVFGAGAAGEVFDGARAVDGRHVAAVVRVGGGAPARPGLARTAAPRVGRGAEPETASACTSWL